MPSEKNKWIDATARLLMLTQEARLIWDPNKPPDYLNSQADHRVDVVYKTRYKDKTLRLYELRYKVEKPDLNSAASSAASIFDYQREYPYWTKRTVLELLDQDGLSPWAFPQTAVLDDLLESVRYQVSGVKNFMDEILAEAS